MRAAWACMPPRSRWTTRSFLCVFVWCAAHDNDELFCLASALAHAAAGHGVRARPHAAAGFGAVGAGPAAAAGLAVGAGAGRAAARLGGAAAAGPSLAPAPRKAEGLQPHSLGRSARSDG